MKNNLSLWKKIILIFIGAVCIISIWELFILIGIVNELLLPHPFNVITALIGFFKSTSFWIDLGSTIWTWLLGVLIGTLLGGILGLFLALNKYIWVAIEPWIEFLRSLPSVVLVPLVSIFVGVGSSSRLICATLVVFLIMMSSSASAVYSTRSSYLRLSIAWRLSAIQKLFTFYLPATLSHLAVALKTAIPIALIVTVASDMLIATDSGIGKILMDSYAVFNTKKLYAGVIIVGILGYSAVLLSSLIERKFLHWRGE